MREKYLREINIHSSSSTLFPFFTTILPFLSSSLSGTEEEDKDGIKTDKDPIFFTHSPLQDWTTEPSELYSSSAKLMEEQEMFVKSHDIFVKPPLIISSLERPSTVTDSTRQPSLMSPPSPQLPPDTSHLRPLDSDRSPNLSGTDEEEKAKDTHSPLKDLTTVTYSTQRMKEEDSTTPVTDSKIDPIHVSTSSPHLQHQSETIEDFSKSCTCTTYEEVTFAKFCKTPHLGNNTDLNDNLIFNI